MPEQPSAFRMNSAVLFMLAVTFVALALPVTLLILGVRQATSNTPADSPEIPGLRVALEGIATTHLAAPPLSGGARRFSFSGTAAEMLDTRAKIEKLTHDLGGTVLFSPTGDQCRLLIAIPEPAAGSFEKLALGGGIKTSSEPGANGSLYEIVFHPAP